MDSPPQIEIDLGPPTPVILAMDDDLATLQGITDALSPHGFNVITAPSWPGAARWLEEQCFDLVLCGLMLDGPQLVELIAAPSALTTAPVVFLSRNEFLGGFIGTRGAARFAVLHRPVSGRQLIACVRRWLGIPAKT